MMKMVGIIVMERMVGLTIKEFELIYETVPDDLKKIFSKKVMYCHVEAVKETVAFISSTGFPDCYIEPIYSVIFKKKYKECDIDE